MPVSIIIVDDFLANPHKVREAALSLEYPTPEKQMPYPGRNSKGQLLINGLDEQFSRYVGERVRPTPNTGHAQCRITLAGDKGRGAVHNDSSDWSGILYLTLPEHCEGGTNFYRHLPTGTERAPITQEELDAMGYSSFKDVVDKIIAPDGTDPDKWERVLHVPMRFNRLVILRPWLWHNAGAGFGDSLENGRLVHLLFYSGPDW